VSTLFNTVASKLRYYEHRAKGAVYSRIPWSFVDGKNVTVDILMYAIIKFFVKDRYNVIVDPTCGTENYLFSKIIDILEYWGIEYKACDLKEGNWSGNICNVFEADTLPEGDVFVYDPPYVPYSRIDKRGENYGTEIARSPEEVKEFYSKQVFENFESRGAKLIIVKGSDFYYPVESLNFYSFHRDILEVPENFKMIANIVYRFYHNNNNLVNVRLAKALEKRNIMRPHVVHTYFVILKKR